MPDTVLAHTYDRSAYEDDLAISAEAHTQILVAIGMCSFAERECNDPAVKEMHREAIQTLGAMLHDTSNVGVSYLSDRVLADFAEPERAP